MLSVCCDGLMPLSCWADMSLIGQGEKENFTPLHGERREGENVIWCDLCPNPAEAKGPSFRFLFEKGLFVGTAFDCKSPLTVCIWMRYSLHRQTNRETNIQTNKQTNKHIVGQTNGRTDTQTDTHTNGQTDTQTYETQTFWPNQARPSKDKHTKDRPMQHCTLLSIHTHM